MRRIGQFGSGRVGHGIQLAAIALKRELRFAVFELPNAHRTIPATGGKLLAAWRKRQAANRFAMSAERLNFATGGQIPALDGGVPACRKECLTIGGKEDRADRQAMTRHREQFFAGGLIPES